MIKVDTKQIIKYERMLHAMGTRGAAYALRDTTNDLAFTTMDRSRRELPGNFTLRTPWTKRSISFRKAKSLTRPVSHAGSTEGYMGTQEEGGVRNPTAGNKTVPIPTAFASNEAPGRKRLKPPTSRKKMRNIDIPEGSYLENGLVYDQISDGTPGGNARAVQAAAYGSNKFVVLKNTGRSSGKSKKRWSKKAKKNVKRNQTGIFKVMGGRNRKGRHLQMVHQMEKPSVRIKPKPWLDPAARYAIKRTLVFHRGNLQRQLARANALSR